MKHILEDAFYYDDNVGHLRNKRDRKFSKQGDILHMLVLMGTPTSVTNTFDTKSIERYGKCTTV